ncbi:MAG: YeeE/YedE family protein [Syntrophaceae bacterium]|nr:YeeE/YedE family protein [Syntrophaceae bacterium]
MLTQLHAKTKLQLVFGFITGLGFGFFLHKGGVTKYDVIVGQLLLKDFTVVKVMISAVITGMLGIYIMKALGWVKLHPKPGSAGVSILGGLVFGVGFATLGYCPGTMAGALGNGYLDALAGIGGMLIGAGLFAAFFPKLRRSILSKEDFGDITIPRLFKVNEWFVIIPICALLFLLLKWIESRGL